VIAIVKLVVVEAVRKVEIPSGFPRALFVRLFHSFWPADSLTFSPSLLFVYVLTHSQVNVGEAIGYVEGTACCGSGTDAGRGSAESATLTISSRPVMSRNPQADGFQSPQSGSTASLTLSDR
jgi:hypothetical protein